ncbi:MULTISPECIES: glyoxalase [unclassified Streptomyces]|uniref:glyoxalase n=1 Tax=unclassified Streptomyces TaxID=2593676 RepID=UPI000DB9DE1E|nr:MULTISPECIES: glyoxalase [unclassified Streptomyces]MYT72101.1 glyoxalase [Streptomyces sp. SID8367]RAJ81512.1 putative lactoylglutathione lyase [Streptomyces sp. PsTaAH-137]
MATTASTTAPVALTSVTLEVADVEAATAFYSAFGVDAYVRLQKCEAPADGFRGFTLALTVSGPATVDGFVGAAVDAGATVLKPATKSLWGYGGVVRAPDGTIWKIATSAKKDTGPATREIDDFVLLLGVEDVKATKQFYVERGLSVAKSFGGKYAEFAPGAGPVKLALYKRRGLAKDLGVTDDGTGAHHIVVNGTGASFTDLDGFVWEGGK